MRFTYDPQADASYVSLLDRDLRRGEAAQQSGIIETPSGAGSIIIDYNKEGRVLGFEILFCSAVLPVEVLEDTKFDQMREVRDSDSGAGRVAALWRIVAQGVRRMGGKGD